MKLKVKFDAQSIKEFFIRHTEKIVFGAMFLVLLLFVYAAMGREQLGFKPEDLANLAQQAEQNIQRTPAASPVESVDYLGQGKRIRTPIEEKPYQHDVAWNLPLYERKKLRGEPPLFPIEELRAAAGHGAVPATARGMAGGAAMEATGRPGQNTEGIRWVVVTGIVPDAKQREEALAFFEGTEPPTANWDRRQDIPEIYYYRVERAEITGDEANDQQLRWKAVNVRNAMRQAMQFGSGMREVVSPLYLLNSQTVLVAFPLPPVAGREWGEEVAHLPAIPLAPTDGQGGMYGMGPMGMEAGRRPAARPETREQEKTNEIPQEEADLPDLPAAGGGRGAGMMEMGVPGAGAMRMGPAMMGPRTMPSLDGGMVRGGAGMQDTTVEETRVKLFRFFDFTVEPGKRYKYRVKLLFTNPNLGLATRILENEELAKKPYLESEEWSEPSEVVVVPRDSRVLAGSVKASAWVTTEPKGTLGIAFFDMKTGAEQFEEFKEVLRGQLLNFLGRPVQGAAANAMRGPGIMGPGMLGLAGDVPPDLLGLAGGKAGKKAKPKEKERVTNPEAEEVEKVDYLTDTVLLDMLGGAKLPGRDREATEPGRYLLLDPDGVLTMIDESDCAEEYQRFTEPEANTPRGPGGMMSPGFMEMGEPPAKGTKAKGKAAKGAPGMMGPGIPGMPGMMAPGAGKGAAGKGRAAGRNAAPMMGP